MLKVFEIIMWKNIGLEKIEKYLGIFIFYKKKVQKI